MIMPGQFDSCADDFRASSGRGAWLVRAASGAL